MRDCFITAAGSVTLVDCQQLHDGQVFALDVPLVGVALEELSPDVWSSAAAAQCAAAFAEFTGGAVETTAFSIAAVLTSPGEPPVIACAAVSQDGSQWAGTAEQIVGAYEGIDVGECFNFPTQESDAEEVGCDEPHEAEMFLLESPIGIDDPLAPYPTQADWDEIAARLCDPALAAYTGQPVGTGDVAYTYVYPLESSWLVSSQRTMSCAAVNFDGTLLTAPIQA
jgi:Septum formation